MNKGQNLTIAVLICVAALAAVLYLVTKGPRKTGQEAIKGKSAEDAVDIKARLAQYAPTPVKVDPSLLTENERAVLAELIAAARKVDDIYWKQSAPEGLALKAELERSADLRDRDFLRYLLINFGPWDRLDENRPFIGTKAKPAGAAFYPPDLAREEFEAHLKERPELRESFESPYTIIRRKEGGLEAVPYNIAYREDLEAAAGHLRRAADITDEPELREYLPARADDLLSNDYYKSDCLWIDLKKSTVEIVIGPYEVYEDGLLGLKAAYESYVYVNDWEETAKVRGCLDFIGDMQKNLPVAEKYKAQEVAGLESPLHVVYEVFAAGDARAGVQTSAFVLPNDEKVREQKGTKKVFLKNVMQAKFEKCLVPIARRVLAEREAARVSFFAYFTETMLHEISHALGLNYITLADGTRTTVNKALRDLQPAVEEAKADVVGVYQVPLLIEKGWIPADREQEIYATYLAGMFRAVRFGANEAHGLGTLVQLNYLREKGAFVYDEAGRGFSVDPDRVRDAVRSLAAELLIIEGDGDYDRAGAFLKRYSGLSEEVKALLAGLKDIPVDIAPVF